MKKNVISPRNIKIYYGTEFLRSLIFTIAVIIVFLQGRASVVQISFLYAFRYFIQVISELPTGAVADLLGKRISIVLGYAVMTLAYILMPFAQNFLHLLVLYGFLQALAESLLSGSIEAMLYDSLKQDGKENQFRKIMANEGILFQAGLIAASVLGGFLYEWNYLFPFILYALATALAFLLSLYFIEPSIDTEVFTLRNYAKQIRDGSREAFKNKHLTKVSIFYMLVGGITWACSLYFNKFILVELGFSDSARGIIQGGLRFINILILSNLLRNEKLFTKKVSFLFFPFIMVISLLPGVWLGGLLALPFVSGSMMASTARWIVLSKYTNEEFSSKYRATAISTLSMLMGVVYIALMLISGPIIANFGGVHMVYTLLGMLSLVTVLPLAISIVREEK